MNFLDAIKKYAPVLILYVMCIVVCLMYGVVFYVLFEEDRDMETRIEMLESEAIRINNECVHMREMDTLILNMSEYNNKDIESIEENLDELSKRVRKIEEDLNYLYFYD